VVRSVLQPPEEVGDVNLRPSCKGFFAQIVVLTCRRSQTHPGSTSVVRLAGLSAQLGFSKMAKKSRPVGCTECEQLWKDYGDASLKRVRAYGNLKLANLRSDSETMEMLAEAAALADQRLEEVKRKIREHESAAHFQKRTQQTT